MKTTVEKTPNERVAKYFSDKYTSYLNNLEGYHSNEVETHSHPELMCLQYQRRSGILDSVTELLEVFTKNPARVLSAFAEFDEKQRKQGIPPCDQFQELTAAMISLSAEIENVYQWAHQLNSEVELMKKAKVAEMIVSEDGELENRSESHLK